MPVKNDLMKNFKWVERTHKKLPGGIKMYDLHAREGLFGKFPGMTMFSPEYSKSIEKITQGYESPKGWERAGYTRVDHPTEGRYYNDMTGRHFPRRSPGPPSAEEKKIKAWQEKKGKMIDAFVNQYSKTNPFKRSEFFKRLERNTGVSKKKTKKK